MMVAMKLSLRRTPRMAFQSVAGSPMRRQMDSIAIFTIFGGLASVRISTRCCLFIDLTATDQIYIYMYIDSLRVGQKHPPTKYMHTHIIIYVWLLTCTCVHTQSAQHPPPHTHTHTHACTHLAEPV